MSQRFTDADLFRLQAHIDKTGSPDGFQPTPRRRMRNDESQMQQAVIRWWSVACRQFKVPEHLLMSIPNGGRRDEITGALLKKEGARRGAPDLLLCAPSRGKHALFIEMKTEKGRVSPEQATIHNQLRDFGYAVEVCRSTDEAIKTIETYLNPHV